MRRQQQRQLSLRASFAADSVNEETRTVDVVFTTGHKGKRRKFSWFGDGEEYYEELAVDDKSIRMDRLATGAPVLNMHRQWSLDSVLGVVERAWVENGQGHATLRFHDDDESEKVFRKVAKKILRNVSVGYIVHRYEDVSEKGDKLKTYRAVDWEPAEISVVPIGFDPGAQTRAAEQPEVYDVEIICNRSESDEPRGSKENMAQKNVASKTSESTENRGGEAPAAPATQVDLDQVRKEAAEQERSRVAGIMTAVRTAKLGDDFAKRLIDGAVSLDESRAQVLEALAAKGDDTEVRSQRIEAGAQDEITTRKMGIESALLHRADSRSFELHDAGRQYRHLSLLDLARECLEGRGIRTREMSKLEIAGRALHSTSDFAEILANTAGKSLRQAYEAAPQTFTPFVRVVEVPDFKQVSRVQLGDAPTLEKVLENGEFKRGTVGEAAEKYNVETYGKVIGITRQVIVNDDLDAFTRVPMLFGRSAADKESDLVYSVLTANANMADGVALFHADHGNLGTAGNITELAIGEARELGRLQTGINGRLMNVIHQFVIVPANLETVARKYLATEVNENAASTFNPWKGLYDLIVEPRLDASSATNWYMAASPGQIDTIELAYLQGQRGVYMETREGFDVDGVEVKCRLDVAAKAIDWRGLFKNPYAG